MRPRWRHRVRYWFYECVISVASNFRGPVWLWAVCRQDRLQQREEASGRPWKMAELASLGRNVGDVFVDAACALLWVVTLVVFILRSDHLWAVCVAAVCTAVFTSQLFFDSTSRVQRRLERRYKRAST